jgi:hypothetical protein
VNELSMVNLEDLNFQLAPSALDVAAGQVSPHSCTWRATPNGPAELVTRNTFLEFAECHDHGAVNDIGRRKRAMSEGTGRKLMEAGISGQGEYLPPPASDSDSLGSGVVEASTSTGGDGPSECCASEAEQMQWPGPSRKWYPAIATHIVQENVWMPSGYGAQTAKAPHGALWHEGGWHTNGVWNPHAIQYTPQPQGVCGPSGPGGIFHIFGGISEAERVHNRGLWS